MAKHKIVIDTKVSVWRRTEMEIEAEDLETARKKGEAWVMEDNDSNGEVVQTSSDYMHDTEEPISDQENYCAANAGILAPKFSDDDGYYKCCEFQKEQSYKIEENPPA